MSEETIEVPIRCATPQAGHWWFGYYDKFPWDATGRKLLAMRSAFADRSPNGEDVILLGTVDLENDFRFEPFGETTAWCWQQGCMLQWLPNAPDRAVLYNTREGDHFCTVIHDLKSGKKRTLPRSTYCVSHDGRAGLSLNHARLHAKRPGYGYPGVHDPFEKELIAEKDGVWHMDLETGKAELILSVARVAAYKWEADMDGVPHWFNHLQFNAADSRFVFLHRYAHRDGRGMVTRMFTAAPDGSALYLLRDRMASHFDWRDEKRILCWAKTPGTGVNNIPSDNQFILFTDQTDRYEVVGKGVLTHGVWDDGHCSYSPDRRWLLNDTYPDKIERKCTLMLYAPKDKRRVNIGRFYSPPQFDAELRCDLHPRWSRDGRQICFDSTHEGVRRIYLADVSALVG